MERFVAAKKDCTALAMRLCAVREALREMEQYLQAGDIAMSGVYNEESLVLYDMKRLALLATRLKEFGEVLETEGFIVERIIGG